MAAEDLPIEATWAPPTCTLPTAERPLRTAEFDELFATSVQHVTRTGPTQVTLNLRPGPEVAALTADLMARETGCCGFFTFALVAGAGTLRLDVTVSAAHVDVLEALTARATSAVAATS